mgnify:CR=1 FL=1
MTPQMAPGVKSAPADQLTALNSSIPIFAKAPGLASGAKASRPMTMRRSNSPSVPVELEHRQGTVLRFTIPGFTSEHGVKRLVWFETHESVEAAIRREKRLKEWQRGVEDRAYREDESRVAGSLAGHRWNGSRGRAAG